MKGHRFATIAALVLLSSSVTALPAETVLVEFGSPMRYLANISDPGVGLAWSERLFDDAAWPEGTYGVGYDMAPYAVNLIATPVADSSQSVYTRTRFTIDDVSTVENLFLGVDYDDGYVAWINGVEVHRSPWMPPGVPFWNTIAVAHESSNGTTPIYRPLRDISTDAIPLLSDGENVLAIGVWNTQLPSSDLVLVPLLTMNHPPSLARDPYLQLGTPESIVLRWRTDRPSDSRVALGPSPGSLTDLVEEPALTTEHVVEITGLSPDTRYFYSVGSSAQVMAGDDDDHFFLTPPLPGVAKPTRIWVLGDSGTADIQAKYVRDAYRAYTGSRHTDLWLMLGDNAGVGGTQHEYERAVFEIYTELLPKSVLWPTLGNHDGYSADSLTQSGPYYEIFTLPTAGEAGGLPSGTEAYYSFDYGSIHFICLESQQIDRSPTGAMMTWLQQDALATSQDWIIAFWHNPPYTKGPHDSDTEINSIEMRENALPLLEDAGVDLVLSGHSHSYERSFLLDGHYGHSGTLATEMILDGGDGREDGDGAYGKPGGGPVPHLGTAYVVAGSSGKVGVGPLDHPAMHISLRRRGSLVLDIDGDRLDATFLDAVGTIRDRFTILKSSTNVPPVAVAGEAGQIECTSPGGATAALEGSGSRDADSTPGTNDDLVSFEWFEDFGLASEIPIGTGENVEVPLSIGPHEITLRVTDSAGATDTDAITVSVEDTVPPQLSVDLRPSVLWPPNHRMAWIQASTLASDACSEPAVTLLSVTSSEPEDAPGPGDGRTTPDIRGADLGSHDLRFSLRAEHGQRGLRRIYTVVYGAADAAGNVTTVRSFVVVPRHRNQSRWGSVISPGRWPRPFRR